METSAFIAYLSESVNSAYSRARLLDMTNRAQNEILGNSNAITRITPDPYIHTGSASYTGAASVNTSGLGTFTVTATIESTAPTKGYLIITDSGTSYKLKYSSYSGAVFTLADGVTLPVTFTGSATATVDEYRIVASGGLFSSIANETTQWDVRKVSRVYGFEDKNTRFGSYGYTVVSSFRPDRMQNYNSQEVEISCETVESLKANNEDSEIILWRENAPGTTTDNYICEAYRWPDQLTSESVSLTIPDQFQTTLLFYAVVRDLEYREYGRSNQPEVLYEKYLKEFLAQTRVRQTSNIHYSIPRF